MNPVYFTPSSILKKKALPPNHHFYHKTQRGKKQNKQKTNPHCDFLLLLLYHLGQKAYYKEIILNFIVIYLI